MLMRQNGWIKLWGNIPMQMIYETMGNHTHKTKPLDEEGNHARKKTEDEFRHAANQDRVRQEVCRKDVHQEGCHGGRSLHRQDYHHDGGHALLKPMLCMVGRDVMVTGLKMLAMDVSVGGQSQ